LLSPLAVADNRRLDEWVTVDRLNLATVEPEDEIGEDGKCVTCSSSMYRGLQRQAVRIATRGHLPAMSVSCAPQLVRRVRKRKVEEHDEGEHEGFDATQLKEHEEFTKARSRCAQLAAETSSSS